MKTYKVTVSRKTNTNDIQTVVTFENVPQNLLEEITTNYSTSEFGYILETVEVPTPQVSVYE